MLGIDALQLRLYHMDEEDEERKPSSRIPAKLRSALIAGTGTPGLSSRVRERSGGGGGVGGNSSSRVRERERERSHTHTHAHSQVKKYPGTRSEFHGKINKNS